MPSSPAPVARRAALPAPSTATAAAGRHPAQRRAIEEFPARQLAELLQECHRLPHGLLSAPPPGIEGLSARERGQLEATLTDRFMAGPHNMHATTGSGEIVNLPEVPPAAREAMQAWLMVQSARMRQVAPDAVAVEVAQATREIFSAHIASTTDDRINFNLGQLRLEARAALGNHPSARVRPEYATALNNLLRLLDPGRPLHPVLRSQVMAAFQHHSQEGRISPQVDAVVAAHGIEALAGHRFRLNGHTGAFQSEAERLGRTPARTPELAVLPRPSGEGSSSAAAQPEPVQPSPALNLTSAGQRWVNQTLDLSSAPRQRTGKLPDSRQYQYIKSLPPQGRAALEATLEALFTQPADRTTPETTRQALTAWLTVQQVRLRVHSEASLKRHAKALRSVGNAANLVKAKFGKSSGQSEFSRFHSEHGSANRPEYATALNNFLSVLRPSSPLSPELKQLVAARLTYHAETEGTLSAPVLEEMRRYGPLTLAADGWKLHLENNVFGRPPAVAFGYDDKPSHLATPVRYTPPRPRDPG